MDQGTVDEIDSLFWEQAESGFRPAPRRGRLSPQRSLGPSYSHLDGDTPRTLGRPRRKRTTEPANRVPSLFRSTEERRSPESCSSFRSREQPRAEVITVVLGCRTWAKFRGCSLSVPSAAKLWRAL